MMKKTLFGIIQSLIVIPLAFTMAWIPMLAWNYGVHSVFPTVPSITYIQAFWMSVLASYLRRAYFYKEIKF